MKAGSGASCALRSSVSNIGASPGRIKASPPARPIARMGTPAAAPSRTTSAASSPCWNGDEIARLVFSKQRRVSGTRWELRDVGAHVAGERHFRQRHGEAAIREIMRRADAPGKYQPPNEVAVAALGGKIDRRRRAVRAPAKIMRIG